MLKCHINEQLLPLKDFQQLMHNLTPVHAHKAMPRWLSAFEQEHIHRLSSCKERDSNQAI